VGAKVTVIVEGPRASTVMPIRYLKVWTEDRAEGGVMIIESDFPRLQRLDGIDRDHFELPVRLLPQ
jgi:hypothetical protein